MNVLKQGQSPEGETSRLSKTVKVLTQISFRVFLNIIILYHQFQKKVQALNVFYTSKMLPITKVNIIEVSHLFSWH